MLKGSDWDIVLDDDTYLRAQQNETQGFLLEEMHARRQPGIGMIPMEVLIQRPLGNINPMPFEMHNKSGLYPLAFEDLKGECMSRQLQIAIVVREQKNGVCKMVPEFDLSELTKHGGLIDQACLRLANGDAEATYVVPTPTKDERTNALMPMAIAMENWLKKVGDPQTIQQVKTFIRNKTLKCPDLDYIRLRNQNLAKTKLANRDEAFIKLFPEKFKLEFDKVSIVTDHPPLPHPDGLSFPYETQGWRDIGITAELAAEVCVMTGHPCLVMHNTTLIYERYPEGWTTDTRKPMVCFIVWGNHGFFYQTSESNVISHKKVRIPPKLTEKKLYNSFDEDIQTNFEEMREYRSYNDIRLAMEEIAIGEKKSVCFWAPTLEGLRKDLEGRRISFSPT